MIEKQLGTSESWAVPDVKIERVKVEKPYWKDYEGTSADVVSEYEFQEDPKWEFPREKLELGEVLGEGAFGRVVKGTVYSVPIEYVENGDNNDGRIRITDFSEDMSTVAVKMLKEGHTDADMIDFVKEMEIMKMIGQHRNIINILGVCSQPSGQNLLVIVEYAEHGNLRDFLRSRRPEMGEDLSLVGDRIVCLRDMLSFGWQVG